MNMRLLNMTLAVTAVLGVALGSVWSATTGACAAASAAPFADVSADSRPSTVLTASQDTFDWSIDEDLED